MDIVIAFTTLAQVILVLVTLSIILGVFLRIYLIFIAALAFPTYLGLYYLETFIPIKFFRLNLAKKNPTRFIMNLCAAMITICVLTGFKRVWGLGLNSNKTTELKFIEDIFSAQLYSNFITIVFIVCVSTIYLVSNVWAKEDQNDYWTKIENLSIPSLWRNILGNK